VSPRNACMRFDFLNRPSGTPDPMRLDWRSPVGDPGLLASGQRSKSTGSFCRTGGWIVPLAQPYHTAIYSGRCLLSRSNVSRC
jgi:hypothetical protein